MSDDTLLAPTLFDLLCRSWTLPGTVSQAVYNAEETAVAFAAEGVLGIASLADPERPETRMRTAADTGRHTILPRERPVRPLERVEHVCGPVAPYGGRSFLTGSARGGLVTVTPRGQAVRLRIALPDGVAALARDPASEAMAVGSGTRVLLLPPGAPEEPEALEIGEPVTALAYAPDGAQLAVGHALGVSFVAEGRVGGGVALESAPRHLSYSPDGRHLACGLAEPGFALVEPATLAGELVQDYPTLVEAFAWSEAGAALATSGAFRTVAWALAEDGLGDALEAGRNGLVIVERVAASPDRPLIASGYANGLVCIAEIGRGDEMMLRAGGGAVSALAWARDGTHMAFGDAAGQAALAAFPRTLFK
ncbi:MAG: hypothetical protein AAF074_02560 [Pseudomonadota bacterium]